jgi:hypothetical protein
MCMLSRLFVVICIIFTGSVFSQERSGILVGTVAGYANSETRLPIYLTGEKLKSVEFEVMVPADITIGSYLPGGPTLNQKVTFRKMNTGIRITISKIGFSEGPNLIAVLNLVGSENAPTDKKLPIIVKKIKAMDVKNRKVKINPSEGYIRMVSSLAPGAPGPRK